MEKKSITSRIEIMDYAVKIDDAVLDSEVIEIIEDIQNDLGDHYRAGLGRIQGLLLDFCEDLPIEYDETVHLLQMLSNLRRDIRALMWGVNPLPPEMGYRRRIPRDDEDCYGAAAPESDPGEGDGDTDDEDSKSGNS